MATTTDQKLEQMKQKYGSVLREIDQQHIRLSHVHIQDGKLFIQGAAPSEDAKNKVWDQIKLVNPQWSQELTADISVDQTAAAQQPQSSAATRTHTVQPGDTLSKISQQVYGNPNAYMKIFEANRGILSNPNEIKPGQVLTIPA